MKLSQLNITLKLIGYLWCFIALLITWVSTWALINDKTSLFGVTVFNVKDSYALALLLFPGVIVLMIPYILEKCFAMGMTKNAVIKEYNKKLAPLLLKRYGRSEHYTYGQVKKTVLECKLNQTYIFYAYAMFLSSDDYDKNVLYEDAPKFSELREELADRFFDGNINFDTVSMIKFTSTNNHGFDSNSMDGGNDISTSDGGSGDG
ncbi:MAG: hypothetical protein KZQ89_19505 [Candidatus Thiodiazotropha sp. (ex Lucinoma kastoroae)]|nr:hypothetical protein [Candidatus Thiodiazotropha sp. (ex Lucinoma kastoroae)]